MKSDEKMTGLTNRPGVTINVPSQNSKPSTPQITNKPPPTTNSTSSTICTKMAASEPKIVRKLLPFAAFLITFATVMTILMVYMDKTAMRHHQFQINMTQDYDIGVAQDNEKLILFIREFCIRPAIDSSMSHKSFDVMHQKQSEKTIEPTEKEKFVADLLDNKKYGTFIEAGAYRHDRISDTEWLERNLSWTGLLIQTYSKDLFSLLKRGRAKSKYIHACLSTQPHPKEITIPQETQDGVKINSVQANSVFSDESEWFNTRIKCFPLYSLILAMNATTNLDFLSLETDCNEFEILSTLPFDRVKIKVISIHFPPCNLFAAQQKPTISSLKRFFASNKYNYVKHFGDDYIFVAKV